MRRGEAGRRAEGRGELGLVFDFDGVIALSEPVHVGAWEDVAREFGRGLPEGFAELGIGRTDRYCALVLAEAWGEGMTWDAVLRLKQRHYRRRAAEESVLAPGVVETLRYFAGRAPMAIATSSSRHDLEPYFQREGIGAYFDEVLTFESVQEPKPHPEIYLLAASRLGLPPERCVVFEDSVQGATAARAAGTRLIGMTTSFTAEELAPVDAHLPDFADLAVLLGILERISDRRS